MRILSSAEKCRRVARRIFFTTSVAGSFSDTDFCLIFAPWRATMSQKSPFADHAFLTQLARNTFAANFDRVAPFHDDPVLDGIASASAIELTGLMTDLDR
jgi:hypothetical protein